MTDTHADDGQGDQTDEPSPRDLRHQLAEEKREAAELRAQLEAVQRDAAFTKALGPAADAPWVRYFQAGYDGPTEAEAIKKAASEAGFLTAPDQQNQHQQNQSAAADPSAYDRIASASTGSGSPGPQQWQDALNEASRVSDEDERTAAILGVVERFGGVTSRTAQ